MKGEYMNSYERVMAVFNHKEPDRLPVITPTSIATVESMKAVNACFPDVHLDAAKMAALAATGHDLIGFDTVAPYFSVQQEAAALGAEMRWGTIDSMPDALKRPVSDPEGFVIPDDLLERKPIKTVIDAVRILKEKYGDTVAVVGKVMGPWTLSYNLYGTQDFLVDTVLEPERAAAFLQAFKEISLRFAIAQVEAGADIITWADHATGDLVSPQGYEQFLLPVQTECIAEFRKRCPKYTPVMLHTCGRTNDRLHLFAKVGFDAFHFDSRNDPKEMLNIAGDQILLTGCVNNPKVLLNGTPEDVREQVTQIVNAGVKLISPECAIPCRVSNKNLQTIVETVQNLTIKE